ncbi:hypothetical protein JOM56_001739 [Amanita muscaria]
MSKRSSQGNQESSRKRSKPVFRTACRTDLKDFESVNGIQSPITTSSRVFTLRTNDNGRRARYSVNAHHHQQNQVGVEPSPSNSFAAPEDAPPVDSSATGIDISSTIIDTETAILEPSPKKKRIHSNTTSTKLQEWLAFRQTCLDEILRHDGRGDFLDCESCVECGKEEGMYKCRDCFDGSLLRCQSCLVSIHGVHPLHRIEKWNGTFFERVSLQEIGLVVQLGHAGGKCVHPTPGPVGFCVFDATGVHRVTINYCDCGKDGFIPYWVQILRAGWFPATFNRPRTVFTFTCLDFFHELTLQGKTSIYDFYHTILRRTDNLGLDNKKVYCYAEFHRSFRIWRGLLMLKRAGRGQDPAGASATAQGELALECPACPHPGYNLPDGWQNVGPGLLFLYTLFLAVDANFKLKQKNRGIQDPELYPGWAYFVNEGPYQDFINNYIDQPEISTCQSEHDAIVRAAVRCTPGYSVTGTALVLCPRHGLIRKNGVGDLQKGERYCNVDYTVLSSLVGVDLPRIVITYDIACQWSKNFLRRMEEFPAYMRLRSGTEINVGIPSWHINGHGAACRSNFSLGYMKGMGRTCGEEIETSWAQTNALGTSTREMGPGARHETLNDQWGGFNFRKITGFRVLFLKRLKEAHLMREKHREIFSNFSRTADQSKPNPFDEPVSATSLQDVRLELAKEDAAEAATCSNKMTLTSFFMTGLDLEEQQRRLRLEAAQVKKSPSPKQQADLEDKRTLLLRHIQCWREFQLVHTPCVGPWLAASLSPAALDGKTIFSEVAESVPLYLPSSLPADLRRLPEMSSVIEKECRLRIAQADDALAGIRHQRRIISGLWQFKRLNVNGTGNKANTRMLTLFNRFNLHTQRFVQRYRAAHSALLTLDPEGSWCTRLHKLHDADVRGPGKDDHDFSLGLEKASNNHTSSGRFEMSWIWLVPRVMSAPDMEVSEESLDESMRVEWMKSRARKERWEEETLLIEEEMRRVIHYFEWKAGWWRNRSRLRSDLDLDILNGVAAYAFKQASFCERMAESCQGRVMDWGLRYSNATRNAGPMQSVSEEDEEDQEVIDDGNDEKGSLDMDTTDLAQSIDHFELDD